MVNANSSSGCNPHGAEYVHQPHQAHKFAVEAAGSTVPPPPPAIRLLKRGRALPVRVPLVPTPSSGSDPPAQRPCSLSVPSGSPPVVLDGACSRADAVRFLDSLAPAPGAAPAAQAGPQVRTPLDHSIVSQLDGLVYALLGVRIERDILAASAAVSHTKFFGRRVFESLSSFIGLYHSTLMAMPAAVRLACRHHAAGMFIVPADPVFTNELITVDSAKGPLP